MTQAKPIHSRKTTNVNHGDPFFTGFENMVYVSTGIFNEVSLSCNFAALHCSQLYSTCMV